jgi:hypothetical protein
MKLGLLLKDLNNELMLQQVFAIRRQVYKLLLCMIVPQPNSVKRLRYKMRLVNCQRSSKNKISAIISSLKVDELERVSLIASVSTLLLTYFVNNAVRGELAKLSEKSTNPEYFFSYRL